MIVYKTYHGQTEEKTSFIVFLKHYESNHWEKYAECSLFDKADDKAASAIMCDKTVESVKVTKAITTYKDIGGYIKKEE